MSRQISKKKRNNVNDAQNGADIEKYTPLVFVIAKRYNNFFPQIYIEDLVAAGKIGLLEASTKYKKDKKTAFSTYAWFWIVKKIQDHISKNLSVIKMPQNVRKKFSLIKRIIEEEAKQGKEIAIDEIAEILSIEPSEVSDILVDANITNAISLDKEYDNGEQARSFSESIEDKSEPDVFDEVTRNSESAMLADMMSKLSDKEQAVLSYRFSLNGYSGDKVSMKDIADKLNISPAKVKDLEQSALAKLKGMIETIDEKE